MKNNNTMRSTRDFLTGLLTGVAIGILTAPRSGKETRNKLTEEANKSTEGLKEQYGKLKEQAVDQYDKVKEQASQYVGQAKDQFNQLKGQAEDKADQFKDKAESEYNKYEAKSDYNNLVDDTADKTKSGINTAKESLKTD